MTTHTALLAAVATLAASPALAEELPVQEVSATQATTTAASAVTAAAFAAVAVPVPAVTPLTSWWQTRPTPEPKLDSVEQVQVDLHIKSADSCPPCGRG